MQSPVTPILPLAPSQCSIPQEVPAHQIKAELELSASPPAAGTGLLLPTASLTHSFPYRENQGMGTDH